jgi:hypothetical protein
MAAALTEEERHGLALGAVQAEVDWAIPQQEGQDADDGEIASCGGGVGAAGEESAWVVVHTVG